MTTTKLNGRQPPTTGLYEKISLAQLRYGRLVASHLVLAGEGEIEFLPEGNSTGLLGG